MRARELFSKRITGYINWHRHRKAFHQVAMLENVMREIEKKRPDHLAITGDLVNIAAPLEISAARQWLEQNCKAEETSLVPGNHDAYVPGAFKSATEQWQPWICEQSDASAKLFPYMKQVGDIAIIGFSTSNATLPFRATGTFTKYQAAIGAELLSQAGKKGLFRTILIHHPPYPNATHRMKRMMGVKRFEKMITQSGAELILHGHTHLNTVYAIETPEKTIHAVGISSASQGPGDKKPVAGFNLFDIEKAENGWRCHHSRYAVASPTIPAELIEQNQLS